MLGALNNKYLLDHRLAVGGMAEVFLGRTLGAEGFSRPVAIKRVLAGFSENPEFAELFVSEAQLTARLQHPNIVSVLDFDRDADGRLFLVMELVDGTDLRGLLATGPLPFSLVIHLGVEILRGLAYAHALPDAGDQVRGLVHRDISPHNVLLSWEGAVKVSDFGIAKARAATAATATATVRGKPAYMSPEQAKGQPLDGRSDLFSVGAILFEMLCSRPLFPTGDMIETIACLLHSPIPSPRDHRLDVPEDLSAVIDSLIARDPARRLQSAAAASAALVACRDYPRDGRDELVATLAHRLGRASVRARRDALGRAHVASGTPPPHNTWTPPPEEHPGRRRVWPWLVFLGLAASGGGAAVVMRSSIDATTSPSISPSVAATLPSTVTTPPAPPAPTVSTGSQSAAHVQGPRHNASSAQGPSSPRSMPAPLPPHHHESPATGSKPEPIHEIQLRPSPSGA
jgi:serine/threonine-protein kinase